MSYRVDNLPWFIKIPLTVYAYSFALFLLGLNHVLRRTCRYRFEGTEHLRPDQPYIFCMWHNALGPYFASFHYRERPHAWLSHPIWYMRPIHVLTGWLGVKRTILGSAGNDGRWAADEIVRHLKEGFSTMINPDGPAGPPYVLKKGALHISKASGVPIVPVRIQTPHALTLFTTWDKKRFPLPFSRVTVQFGEPRVITEANFEDARTWLTRALS